MRTPLAVAGAGLAGLALLTTTGCGSTTTAPAAAPAAAPVAAPTADRPASDGVSKLLVFVVENHSLDQMRSTMPATFDLATTYGYADHYQAITHPSEPNYLAMTDGSTYGITDDAPPAANGVAGPSVFGRALTAGRTATLYAEGMPGPCGLTDGGDRYAVRHNPWAYHVDERAVCAEHDVALDRLAGDAAAGSLPNIGLAVPNTCNDAHDCDLATADSWLHDQLATVMAGPDWASGHLAVVVTADEDDHHQDNTVLTVVAHPDLEGVVVDAPLTHYSLARSFADVAGVAPTGEATGATSLLEAFGLHAAG